MPETADQAFPFDAGAGSGVAESQWRSMARHWLPSGPLVTESSAAALTPTAGAGLQVLVAAGAVWINGHYGEWDAQSALTIGSNTSGTTRVDAIVARLDTVGNDIELDVVAGTPGAGLPALTQDTSTWEILIGSSTLLTGGSSVSVSDWRVMSGYPACNYMIGEVIEWPSGAIPAWALELNGQAVSRTSYAKLYSTWGALFGGGDGTTTFNVMNRKGRVGVGQDTGDTAFDVIGETGGAKTHTLTQAELPSHGHSISSDGSHTHAMANSQAIYTIGSGPNQFGNNAVNTLNGALATSSTIAANGAHFHGGATGSVGSGSSHNNLQPYVTTRYIVRAR